MKSEAIIVRSRAGAPSLQQRTLACYPTSRRQTSPSLLGCHVVVWVAVGRTLVWRGLRIGIFKRRSCGHLGFLPQLFECVDVSSLHDVVKDCNPTISDPICAAKSDGMTPSQTVGIAHLLCTSLRGRLCFQTHLLSELDISL